MPNAKVLSEKQAIVAALAERLNSASAGVFVDYKGITVDEDTKLRTELRQNDVEYSVVKNTLTRFALKDVGLEAMSDLLNGTTSLASSRWAVLPHRLPRPKLPPPNKATTSLNYLGGKLPWLAKKSLL